MSEELKPCPFCGGKARFTGEDGREWVECNRCTASSIAMLPAKEPVKGHLAAEWNRRAPRFTQEEREALNTALGALREAQDNDIRERAAATIRKMLDDAK